MGLRVLVDKMALFITFVTGDTAQVLIFPTCWPVAATIILSQDLGRVDLSSRNGALRLGVAEAAIATISIVPILLVVLARSLSLGRLRAMKRYSLCLVKVKWKGASVPNVILDSF